MITLNSDEFAAIEAGFRERRRGMLLKKLRDDRTIPADLSDSAAKAQIDAIIEDGKDLEIIDDSDVARLAQIVFLPENLRRHPVIGPSMMAVLLEIDQPANDRLDFIFRRVLARAEMQHGTP